MIKKISPIEKIDGELIIPSSKSFSQRAVACALLSNEKSIIKNFGDSSDELTALEILRNSKSISVKNNTLTIYPSIGIHLTKNELLFNESGLSSRLFTPLLATLTNKIKLNGNGSLLKRPMELFDQILPDLEVDFQSNNGKLPFLIKGPLKPKSIEIDGSLSSQFISGLIYAYIGSKSLSNQSIKLLNPSSIPYLELSLDVLEKFGVNLSIKNNTIQFNGPYQLKPCQITIENDWSSASFFIVAAALKGVIHFKGMNPNSFQADRKILLALKEFGANYYWKNDTLTVSKSSCKFFNFDATHCPDLFPALAVLGSFGNSKSTIKGVQRLFSKESNRAKTIVSELTKLGANIEIKEDIMHIYPAGKPIDFKVDSCNDHRIAMASAIFSIMLDQPVEITHAEAVNKSFPSFYKLLDSLT